MLKPPLAFILIQNTINKPLANLVEHIPNAGYRTVFNPRG